GRKPTAARACFASRAAAVANASEAGEWRTQKFFSRFRQSGRSTAEDASTASAESAGPKTTARRRIDLQGVGERLQNDVMAAAWRPARTRATPAYSST